MFPNSFFPPSYFPPNYWPKLGSQFAGHGGTVGGARGNVLAFAYMDQAMQLEMAERARNNLIQRLLVQKINMLADIEFAKKINAQTAYTILMGEV